ncbi:MAG: hypothetical protein FWG91_10265 [Lachnospiraceae bacterium]|nr:hypothetical protein [Lachnospiraceae bacterium]
MKDKLTEQLLKEEAALLKLEAMAKKKKDNIARLRSMIRDHRFSEAEDVITLTGITLEEIILAAQSGDFSGLQKKAEKVATSQAKT